MFPEGDDVFVDRSDAGRRLADRVVGYLRDLGVTDRPLVLGLPRGGMVVAAEVAQALDGDLDLVVSRKIGFPGNPEFGIGAVAEHGPPRFAEEVLRRAGLTESDLTGEAERQRVEVQRRVRRYRGSRPEPTVTGRVVVLVDDGLATGVTARAALADLRRRGPRHLLFAAPVCASDAIETLEDADGVVCVRSEDYFGSVGAWYIDFSETTDDDVVEVLNRAWASH
jgi:predicted phosphoribosyltransferase